MEKDNNNMKKDSLLNSEYLQIFTKVSVWIIGPVLFSLIIGKYLDSKYNTAPWILGLALTLSFTLSMFMIVKIAKKYMGDKDIK
jgi:F0F1-type ATP synthase assembly protein I